MIQFNPSISIMESQESTIRNLHQNIGSSLTNGKFVAQSRNEARKKSSSQPVYGRPNISLAMLNQASYYERDAPNLSA